MPAKYHINTESAPARFRPVGKRGIVEWREDCANCRNCVKKDCVYGFYKDESDTLHKKIGYMDYIYQCKGCLSCVQNCTKGILSPVINPEYKRLGDDYYTPDIILTTWAQAESGRIPVTGSGYGGPFSGRGFDSMWTDMSEIVRPTRDGIHGREYINTSVNIGRKLTNLTFTDDGAPNPMPPLIQSPMPLMFEAVPKRWDRGLVVETLIKAADKLGLFSIVSSKNLSAVRDNTIPLFEGSVDAAFDEKFVSAQMIIVPDRDDIETVKKTIRQKNANQLLAIQVQASPEVAERVVKIVREGMEVIHLIFDKHGREKAPSNPRHMRDVLRDVHGQLVKAGIRDKVTIIASGGIALPEHMAKAIICGADLVAVDLPLMIALECRLCGACEEAQVCPVDFDGIDPEYAIRRIVNLIGAWHSQLLEMLGAMGIREVRRLRGETGRCMFFEDLEAQTFGRLFGKRKDQNGVNKV